MAALGVDLDTRELVIRRARYCCERCNKFLAGEGGHIHHRRPRGMGGSKDRSINLAANLLLLCIACHGWVERNRKEALEDGLLVSQWDDERQIPVKLYRGLVFLLDDGTWRRAEAG